MNFNDKRTDFLILAGRRLQDPLAQSFGLKNKAFVPLLDEPMIRWVIQTVDSARDSNSKLWLSTTHQDAEQLSELLLEWHVKNWDLLYFDEGGSPVDAIAAALKKTDSGCALTVTTADNPLMTPSGLREFLTQSTKSECAFTAGVVNAHDGLLERYPTMHNKRTWHKINSKVWLSGANLFFFSDPANSLDAVRGLSKLEASRKFPLLFTLNLSRLDLVFLLKKLFGMANLNDCDIATGKLLGLNSKVILLSDPEACIDVDKLTDLELAHQILQERERHRYLQSLNL